MYLLHTTITVERHADLLASNLGQFPLTYQQKISKYRRWQDAQASVLGRLLLQRGLKQIYQYDINFAQLQYTSYGKPYLPDLDFYFNISHTANKVVCAIQSGSQLGVDVEFIKPIPITDFRMQMTDHEWRLVTQATDPLRAFYDYWTSKEAILKVHGQGLSLGLKTFEVTDDRRTAEVEGTLWYLHPCEVGQEYLCYVASAEPIEEKPIILETELNVFL